MSCVLCRAAAPVCFPRAIQSSHQFSQQSLHSTAPPSPLTSAHPPPPHSVIPLPHYVIPSGVCEARYAFPSHAFCAMNPSCSSLRFALWHSHSCLPCLPRASRGASMGLCSWFCLVAQSLLTVLLGLLLYGPSTARPHLGNLWRVVIPTGATAPSAVAEWRDRGTTRIPPRPPFISFLHLLCELCVLGALCVNSPLGFSWVRLPLHTPILKAAALLAFLTHAQKQKSGLIITR